MDKKIDILIIGKDDRIQKFMKYAAGYGMSITTLHNITDIINVDEQILFDLTVIFDESLINICSERKQTTLSSIILVDSDYKKKSSSVAATVISENITELDFIAIIDILIKSKETEVKLQSIQDDFCMDYSAEIDDDLRKNELEALNAISLSVSGSLDLQIVLDIALGKILDISGMEMGMIYFIDHKKNLLTLEAHRGLKRKAAESIASFSIEPETVAALVINSYNPVIRNFFNEKEFPLTNEHFETIGELKTLIAIPLIAREQILGILYLVNHKIKIVTGNDIEMLSLAGNQISIAIENARLYKTARFEINERSKAEHKLSDSINLYSRILDNVNDIVFSADINGKVIYMSNVVENIFGYTSGEIVGKPFAVYVHQEDLPVLIKKFQNVLDGKYEPSSYRIRRKDGTYLWVKSSSKVFYKDGKPAGINGIITDITGMKVEESAADDKFHLLSKLTAVIPGFVFKLRHTKDIGWVFDYLSDGADDIGYPTQDMVDNFMLFIGALRMDDQGMLWAELDDSLRNHTNIETMLRYRDKTGNEINIKFFAKPEIWNDNDSIWYGYGIRTDFTGII